MRTNRQFVDPMPPVAAGRVPWVRSGLAFLRDPTAFFHECRVRLGDTFLVEAFGYRVFCVFSPAGVRNLWALPESRASKGLADFALLSHKVPAELFAGRRTMPHQLFGGEDVEVYLDHLRRAVDLELDELGPSGSLEIFAFTRRLAHRMGLASWGGIEAASPRYLDRLVRCLDQLDASESFVHPHKAFWTMASGKRAERRALAEIEVVFEEILRARAQEPGGEVGDLFERIRQAWADVPSPDRERGIARDVALVHMGSQSNLFAAMAWTLVYLLQRPALLGDVRRGDGDLLDRCASESIRLAQRSIVLRQVHRPVELADETTEYAIQPGVFLATMMSVTNATAAPGLESFEPSNYNGRKFTRVSDLPAAELVTTFGHGRHACPAQRFAISAIHHSIGMLIGRYELTPRFETPRPLRRQMGGVARADRPCRVEYRLRERHK